MAAKRGTEVLLQRQGVIHLAEARKLRAVKTAAGWLYDPESVEMFAEGEAKSRKG
jgi:hypothetical protein